MRRPAQLRLEPRFRMRDYVSAYLGCMQSLIGTTLETRVFTL
jgi:hypothetical protein